MKVIELLGLPGVGKSFVLNNRKDKLESITNLCDVDIHFVETGMNVRKLKNMFIGFLTLLFLQPFILLLSFFNKSNYKKTLLLCERIGRTKNLNNSLLDEGIMQACWAVLLNGKGKFRLRLVEGIIRNISSKNSTIIYVSTNKNLIYRRAQKRLIESPHTAYDYHSEEYYIQARQAIYSLLKLLKKNSIKVSILKNN